MSDNPVVAQIIQASGLAPVIAGGVIRRCCAKAGISPDKLTRYDVGKLMPLLEPLLPLYLEPKECGERLAAIRKLAI